MPETTVVSSDGTPLAARRTGRGTPVVMVHGAMADLDAFDALEGMLAERHTVWVYSRRGRGGSGDAADYGIEHVLDDLLAVLDAAGQEAHLFGHSSGAAYALLAAARAPGLRSLMLYEPPLNVDHTDASVLDAVERALEHDDPDGALDAFLPMAGINEAEVQMLRSQPPVWETLRQGVRVFPREYRALHRACRQRREAPRTPDATTLYLFGEETDADVYPQPDEMAEILPNSHFHGIPAQRHMAPMFDPGTVAEAILAFTTEQDRARAPAG